MSTLYTINVKNESLNRQRFFFFQKPAEYKGGSTVYSNSIYQGELLPYDKTGSSLTVHFQQQYYAGAQTRQQPPVVGHASGFTTASQAIDLTSPSGGGKNTTRMSADPFGLSPPTNIPDVQPGAYRIVTPKFVPGLKEFNVGLAVLNRLTGAVVLSNFITAPPASNVDCQPVLTFYVQVGGYGPGEVINFTASSVGAAMCDTTLGFTTFDVTYNRDGSWTVQPKGRDPR